MKSRWVATLVVLAGLFAGEVCWAQTVSPTRVLVMNPESSYLAAGKLRTLAKHLRSLARRYSSLDVVAAPGNAGPQLRLRAGCTGSDAGCLVKIGKVVKVQRLVHTEIQKLPGRYLVVMTLVDVEQADVLEQARKRSRRKMESLQSAILQGWVDLVGPLYRSQVKVNANVRGAEVFLDGRRVGTTPLVLTKDLGKGSHVIELKYEGYESVRQEFEVGAGRDYTIEARLQKEKAPEPLVGVKLGGGKQEKPPLEEPPLATGDQAQRPALGERPLVEKPAGSTDKQAFLPGPAGETPPVSLSDTAGDRTERPFYTRWWFWTAVGAVVVGGVTTGLVLGLPDEGGIPAGKGRVLIDF